MSSQIPQEQLEGAGFSHKAKAEEQAFPMSREEMQSSLVPWHDWLKWKKQK